MKLVFYIILLLGLIGCRKNQIEETLAFSGGNRAELEKVLNHYEKIGDKRKIKAAEFLVENMQLKYYYEGDILNKYDRIFEVFDSLHQQKVYDQDPPVIKDTWKKLGEVYGKINVSKLNRVYDCQTLTANFLIKNIDEAFDVWEKSPYYDANHFDMFCEYILPYRIQNEPSEAYRERYLKAFKHIVDTATDANAIINGFGQELRYNLQYGNSNILWDYPVELSVSKMEKSHKGACRHVTTFQALVMRACGLPVTIDRAIWANRSQGHSWNVLMSDTGKLVAFDALSKVPINFAYKPAKILRKLFSCDYSLINKLEMEDIPMSFFIFDEKDVTSEYVKAFDIVVPIVYPYLGDKEKKQGVICVFDNKDWRIVYWGDIKSDKMHFKNMGSDVLYLGAYYDNGNVIPATDPFLLRNDGSIDFCAPNTTKTMSMVLERKYPRFIRVENWTFGLLEASVEGANDARFDNRVELVKIKEHSFNVADSLINNSQKFRFVRINIAQNRNGDLAEIEFYGKKQIHDAESKLDGKTIGFPENLKEPYTKAMDGDLETWFAKPKNTEGWVGLDLGYGNEHMITKVRFGSRSDTNFILMGDVYELMYWDKSAWKSLDIKTSEQYNTIVFDNVPSGGLYLLHNQTRGKEERIFTYEEGKQIWW